MQPENDTMFVELKDCFGFNSWNSRLTNVVVFTVTMMLLFGSGFVIFGIVHVTGDSSELEPLTNSMFALQALQVPLQKAEHASFHLSLATNVVNATILVAILQAQIYEISMATNQIKAVNDAMGSFVSETLRLPHEIWSQMITMALVNASVLPLYMTHMLGLYADQLPYSEIITALADSTCNAADHAAVDNVEDLTMLCEGTAILLGFAMFACLIMARIRTAYYRDQASHALAIKARFLVLISHEMRTPMNGVMGPLQLLNDALTASEHQPLVRASIASADALLAIVNNLLDYRLLDDDTVSVPSQRVVSVDLYLLLLDIEAMIRPAMFAKNLIYCQVYRSEVLEREPLDKNVLRWPSRVRVDRDSLVQVMMNLLANAHKFTHAMGSVSTVATLLGIYPAEHHGPINSMGHVADGITIDSGHMAIEMGDVSFGTLTTAASAVGHSVVSGLVKSSHEEVARFRIDIVDTGVGISSARLKTVFDVFSGDSDITTRAFDGLGLGLAISSKLATKKLGSRITATSAPGQGSTFSFELCLPIDTDSISGSDQPFTPLSSQIQAVGLQISPNFQHSHPELECGHTSSSVRMDLQAIDVNERLQFGAMFAMSPKPRMLMPIENHATAAELSEINICVKPLSAAAVQSVLSECVDVLVTEPAHADELKAVSPIQPITSVSSRAAVSNYVSPTASARHFSPPFHVVTTRPTAQDTTSPNVMTMMKPVSGVRAVSPHFDSSIQHHHSPHTRSRHHPSAQALQSMLVPMALLATPRCSLQCDPDPDLSVQTFDVVKDEPEKHVSVANTSQPVSVPSSSNMVASPRSHRDASTSVSLVTGVRLSNADVLEPVLASVVHEIVSSPQPDTGKQLGRYLPLPVPRSRTNTAVSRVDVDSAKVETSAPHAIIVPLLTSPLAGAHRTDLTSPMHYPRASAMTPAHGARRAGPTPPVHFSLAFEPHVSTTISQIAVSSAVLEPVAGAFALSLKSPMSEARMPSLRILLVEDNQLNQKVAMGLLDKMGHSVVLAENGQEAVDKWRATVPNLSPINSQASTKVYVAEYDWKASVVSPPLVPLEPSFDICLMDLSMPVLDGYEAATKIRALEKSMTDAGHQVLSLPIIAVSANSIAAKPKCLAVGMQGYISKPIHKMELVEHLLAFGCGRHPFFIVPPCTTRGASPDPAPGYGLDVSSNELGLRENSVKSQGPQHLSQPSSKQSNASLEAAIVAAASQPTTATRGRFLSLPAAHAAGAVVLPLHVDISDSPAVVPLVGRASRPGLTSPLRLTPALAARRSGSTTNLPQTGFALSSPRPVSRHASVSAMESLPESPMIDDVPPLRILLVEDNLSNQRFALTLLDKMGHSVVLAENGQEAVDKWRATLANLPTSVPFDICLMDLSMPVMDGYEAVSTIRALEKTMTDAGQQVIPLPIVAVSANSIEAKPKCLALGMQAYLAKPMRKSELVVAMRAFGCGRLPPIGLLTPESIGPPLRILLVEDNPLKNHYALALLEKLGHSVVMAQNGYEAFDKWRLTLPTLFNATNAMPKASPDSVQTQATVSTGTKSNSNPTSKVVSSAVSPEMLANLGVPMFDVCLMDLTMPIMDGFIATSTIRAVEKAHGAQAGNQVTPMPIVAVSVNPIDALERCLSAGMQGCISKPLLKAELVKQLNVILNARPKLSCTPSIRVASAGLETRDLQTVFVPPLHILVVEDNLLNYRFLVSLLEKMGHSVVLAENGQQAVDKWRATMPPVISTPMNILNSMTLSWSSVSLQALVPNPSLITKSGSPPLMTGLAQAFDICLMDLSMPVFGDLISFVLQVMDGFSATNIIRTIEQTLVQAGEHIIPLAIVAVTGKSIESKPQCLAVGMQGFISKPIIETELVHNLQTFGCQRQQQLSAMTISAMAPMLTSVTSTTPGNIISPETPAGLMSPRSMAFADTSVQFPLTSRQSLAMQQQRLHGTGSGKRHSIHNRIDVTKLSAFSESTNESTDVNDSEMVAPKNI